MTPPLIFQYSLLLKQKQVPRAGGTNVARAQYRNKTMITSSTGALRLGRWNDGPMDGWMAKQTGGRRDGRTD